MVNTTTYMKQQQLWWQENRLHTFGLRAGIWATLQFRWMQLQYPVVALAFERLLLCGSLPVAAMALSWGLVAAVGAGQAPFYLAVLLSGVRGLCVQHHMRPMIIAGPGRCHWRGAGAVLSGRPARMHTHVYTLVGS